VAALGSTFTALTAGPGMIVGTLVVGGILVALSLGLGVVACALPRG
jgi:hypothetical protein